MDFLQPGFSAGDIFCLEEVSVAYNPPSILSPKGTHLLIQKELSTRIPVHQINILDHFLDLFLEDERNATSQKIRDSQRLSLIHI